MNPLLYAELVPFYHLLDPLADHEEEARAFASVLTKAVSGAETLLELGAGAGHGAHFLKTEFRRTTLLDLSEPMLDLSRRLNPDCDHHLGDMRSVRLGRTFDCVLIYDAISHITSRGDLRSVADTTWAHVRPGGAALIIPDCLKETFVESHEDHDGDDDERSLRCISWSYDPDPQDDVHLTDFAFLLREGGEVRAVHDRHEYGLFTLDVWIDVWSQAGFRVEVVERPLPQEYVGTGYTDKMFLCRRT